jgi:hypothetical protein
MGLLFDESDDEVYTTSQQFFRTTADTWTYLVWNYLPAAAVADGYLGSSAKTANSVSYFNCARQNSTGKAYVGIRDGAGDSDETVYTTTAIADDVWCLYSLTNASATSRTVMLNGDSGGKASSVNNHTEMTLYQNTCFGSFRKDSTLYKSCALQDIAIFDVALTDAQILRYYNARVPAVDSFAAKDLILYMPMRGKSEQLLEWTNRSNTWNLGGSPTYVAGPGLYRRHKTFSYPTAGVVAASAPGIGTGFGLFPQDG